MPHAERRKRWNEKILKVCASPNEISATVALSYAVNFAEILDDRLLDRIRGLEKRLEAVDGVSARVAPAASTESDEPDVKPTRLLLTGDITKKKAADLVAQIRATPPAKPIKLTISSRGGNLAAADEIYQELIARRAPTHCHASVDCSSAATLVLLAGQKRTALAGCKFTVHRPAVDGDGSEFKEGAVAQAAASMARTLSIRTSKPVATWEAMLASKRGRRLDSATACELNLVHGLTRPHEPRKGKRK